MAKNSVRDYSATASLNTDVQSVDIDEGCAPSGINNAIREVMADIKDVSTGTIALESPAADSLSVTGNITVSGTVDGRDVAADGTKLDGIESGATADQTKADIDALGIDAETIDGLNSTQFLRSDADDTLTGQLTISGTQPQMKFSDTDTGADDFWIHVNSDKFYILTDRDDSGSWDGTNPLLLNNTTATIQSYGNTVWTAGNDGSGSGLDADTVDGIQASSFLRSDANDTTTGSLTVDNSLIVQNNGVSGQGDNNTHFNYQNAGTNYIRGTNTYISSPLITQSTISSGGTLDMNNNDIIGVDQIIHEGDSNTYIQFHAADQFRVVTGGTERLEVSNNTTAIATDILLNKNNGEINLKTGSTGTSGGINWTFTSTTTNYARLSLPYDTRSSLGFHMDVGYPITIDATTKIDFAISGTTKARIESDGDFHADGNVIAYSTTISDERLKKDIVLIDNALGKLEALNGYTFTYLKDDRKSAGVVAQEVEKVMPSAVLETETVFHGEEGETYKTVQYDQLIGLLIEAVKELKAEVEELKNGSAK